MNLNLPFILIICAMLTGCSSKNSEIKKYAVLRVGDSGKIQVSIEGKYWTPLFTTDGVGGYRQALFCWATLEGVGPEYKDPVLHVNKPYLPLKHTGIIIVDTEKKVVVIRLDQIVPASTNHDIGGIEPEARSGPCPENGTYHIKSTIKNDFITPE